MAYWINELDSIKTNKEEGIYEVIKRLEATFEYMEGEKYFLKEDDKMKYLHNAIPKSYIRRFTYEEKDTFETIAKKIKSDLNKIALYEGWKSKEKYDHDDPMEIDMVRKFKNNNTDNNTKY